MKNSNAKLAEFRKKEDGMNFIGWCTYIEWLPRMRNPWYLHLNLDDSSSVVECHTLRGESTHWGWILALRTRFELWSTPWGAHPNFEGLSCPWGGILYHEGLILLLRGRSSRWGVELHFEGQILYLEVLSCTFVWFMPFLSDFILLCP